MRDLIALIEVFHDAVNAGDADRLTLLASEDVEVGGPRGSGHGRPLLLEWVVRADVRFHPLQTFARGGVAVVEQEAEWVAAMTGDTRGRMIVATLFEVTGGLLSKVLRYDHLDEALAAAGLNSADSMPDGGVEASA